MINWNDLDTLNSYKKMLSLKGQVKLSEVLTADRVKKFEAPMAAGLSYNYAAKQVSDPILTVLQELSQEQQLVEKYQALLDGEVINTGENRKVLHQLARGQLGKDVIFEGKNLRKFYEGETEKIAVFAKKVHSGEIKGSKGDKFTAVCQIGIGGSDLGPRALYLAMDGWAVKNGKKRMDAKFISNVDPDDGAAVVASCDL
ncbi:MAG TPA: glucose-6-phosphate isomerase, partial [Treponemataceae bacterium]|nr:glucose-6-phosphate isomerase [Treponemataceae bacterium]